MVAVDC
jgi:hypothetical protein